MRFRHITSIYRRKCSAVASLRWFTTDVSGAEHRAVRLRRRVRHVDIVYRILSYPYSGRVSDVEVWWQLRDAFTLWSNVSSLTFEEVSNSQPADIEISFVSGYHNDGSPFDGEGLLPFVLAALLATA